MKSTETDRPAQSRRRRSRWLFLWVGLLLAGGVAAVLVPFLLVSTTMGADPALQSASQFALASPDTRVAIALEVTSLPSGTLLTGALLQKNADGSYTRTAQQATVRWSGEQLVMGSRNDIRQGAIVQVSGLVGSDSIVQASQIVVLTGFVQVH
jgi:hypothetical protein